jgi:hypothetical protein
MFMFGCDRRSMFWVLGAVALIVLSLTAVPVKAQIPTGTYLGTVKDSTGGTIAAASVTVTNLDTGLTRTGTTGDDGGYRFPALPVGNYQIQVMKDGFQTAQRKGLTLNVTDEDVIDFTLQVGSTGQTVVVTEEAPLVNTTGASVGGLVDDQKVADLPLNGRNYIDLTLMQGGIVANNLASVPTVGAGSIQPLGVTGTMISSNGASLRSNNSMIDGAIMQNLMGLGTSSIIGTTLGVDGIKEYKVVTSLFSADYGLTVGSQTTIVSKGGSNNWHGDIFEYLRNSAMDARNFFDTPDSTNHNGFGTDKSLPFPGKRLPPFQRNNFGGSFGGPIKKDKTFFYAVYEGLRQDLAPSVTTETLPAGCYVDQNGVSHNAVPAIIDNNVSGATVGGVPNNPAGACVSGTADNVSPTNPTIAVSSVILPLVDVFPAPNVTGLSYNYTFPFKQLSGENYEQLRMDQNFSASDSAFFRYTADLTHQNVNHPYPQWVDHYKSESLLGTVAETHIFSPTILSTVRFSYSRTGLNALSNTEASATPAGVEQGVVINPGQDSGGVTPGSGVAGFAGYSTPGNLFQNVISISDDVFWTKGKNAFKFGTLINHYSDLLDLLFSNRGSISFGNVAAMFGTGTLGGVPDPDYSQLMIQVGSSQRRVYDNYTLGFYAQDDYHMFPRLTLNLGLRYEFMTTITSGYGTSYAVTNVLTANAGTPANPTPNLGGTPDPLFVNPSLHSFSPRFGFAWDVFGNGKTSLRGGAGIYYDIGNAGNLYATNATGGPPLSVLHYIVNTSGTPAIPLTYSATLPTFPALDSSTQPVAPRIVDYHLQQPTMAQWNLTVDHQLPFGMALSVSYIGSKGWHQIQTIEGNPTVPVGYLPNGLPYYGCFNAAQTEYVLPSATTGACNSAPPTCFDVGGAVAASCTGTFNTYGAKTNTSFYQALYSTAGGDSYYHSLQVQLVKQITKGLQFQVNYTFAKALDDGVKSILDPESTASDQDANNLYNDKGPSFVDIRNNLRANVIYHAPNISSDKMWAKPLHGWWFGSIISMQSGYPITPTLGGPGSSDRALQNNINETDRPNLDPSFNASTVVTGNPNDWFNQTMFDLPAAGMLGNAGRGIVRGPDLKNVDFSINKDTHVKKLGEEGAVQFRAEIFNILNHADFGLPAGSIWNGPGSGETLAGLPSGQLGSGTGATAITILKTAGVIGSTTERSRQIQLALKVVF